MNRDQQPTRSKQSVQRLDRTRQQSAPSDDWQPSRTTMVRANDGTATPLDDVEDEEYDDNWPTRLPTSSRRYDTQIWQQGNTRVVAHPRAVQPIPRRTSASQQPPATQEDSPAAHRRPRRRRLHWLVYAGLGAMVALTLYTVAAWASTRWTDTLNDWTYTSAFRTFSVDQVVGHNHDSAAHPSHFIVQNDKGQIVIIEFPADDPARVISYYDQMLIGDGERTPVTISFQLNRQTGRLDLLLHEQGQNIVLANDGTKFVIPSGH